MIVLLVIVIITCFVMLTGFGVYMQGADHFIDEPLTIYIPPSLHQEDILLPRALHRIVEVL